MASLVTPSAKSHERVTGRWVRDLQAESNKDWAVYYTKLIIGTPVPWIMVVFMCAIFVSRAAVEITAWTGAVLSLLYVVADRFAKDREFAFFRAGSDITLLSFVGVSLLGIMMAPSSGDALAGLGSLRWVLLFYLMTWSWQLFPGLNRMYAVLFAMTAIAAIYAVSQHFTGIDLIRGEELSFTPIKGYAYHVITGFYRYPEVLGTIFAVLLPLPAATFMLADKREKPIVHLASLVMTLLLATALLWTYRPGLWIAGGAGILITMVLQPKRQLLLFVLLAALIGGLIVGLYGEPQGFIDQMMDSEVARGERQRTQINEQVEIWKQNTWVGVGMRTPEVQKTNTIDGNLYFLLLAQTGSLGLAFYLLFCASFLLSTYHVWKEVPRTHFWHRVLISGGIAGLAAFHVSGLYWPTLSDSHATNLFVFLLSSLAYASTHYENGLVPDDRAL